MLPRQRMRFKRWRLKKLKEYHLYFEVFVRRHHLKIACGLSKKTENLTGMSIDGTLAAAGTLPMPFWFVLGDIIEEREGEIAKAAMMSDVGDNVLPLPKEPMMMLIMGSFLLHHSWAASRRSP